MPRYLHLTFYAVKGGDSISVISAGLPNITGKVYNFNVHAAGGLSAEGVFSVEIEGGTDTGSNWNTNLNDSINFDASRSSSIYGASTTVQPPALILIPQIRF